MKVWVVGAVLASVLGACNQETAGTPVSASAASPAATLSLADFKGDWTGSSQGGVPIRLYVTDERAGFAYNNLPAQMGEPSFKGNTMRLPFATSGIGYIEVTKESSTKLAWLFDGMHNGVPTKSRSTLTLVK